MKNSIIVFFFSLSFIFGCNSENSNYQGFNEFESVVVDSIQVDYLGSLFLFGYKDDEGLYIGRSNSDGDYILFDETGDIIHQFQLSFDGPNAMSWELGMGILDAKFTIMDQNKGLIQFSNEGEILNRVSIPENYFYFNSLNFPAYKLDENYAYSRPERGDIDWGNLEVLIKSFYQSPLLEVFNPKTGDVKHTMEFPKNTVYESGQYFMVLPPPIIKRGNEWIVYFLAEMKYHVYNENEGEVTYTKTVDLNINKAIPMPSVPIKEYASWYERHGNIIFGKIEQLFIREHDIIVIYTKGVEEDISSAYNPENQSEWINFVSNIPRYAAILDHDHQLIQNDIALPKGLIFTSVTDNEGKILALKHQDYFEVEEDIVTYYKLNFTNAESIK
ncbi:hypothetical protein MM239_15890 [Belliella sp. DSM 111904]|uniref:6-bladed beta-propeller protein n=1 Tax=Belliella filtrata TaxID=2923435 RepID=A0ABS9V4I0_9BACT|nr:hypothetical protein [Belliella filtrata]MCH7410890.1 hypothetical protein [Belliella filtrata]